MKVRQLRNQSAFTDLSLGVGCHNLDLDVQGVRRGDGSDTYFRGSRLSQRFKRAG